MSMTMLQLYKNPYNYPDYGSITAVGNAMESTPVGTGLKTGTIRVKGTMADFMNCNYLGITRNGRTIYAWIEDVVFRNAGMYDISYRVDAWRTYRSRVNLGTQFIERSTTPTLKRDDLLGATKAYPDVVETFHNIGNSSNRILVIQATVGTGEQFSNTPVQPNPHKFYFAEYNIHAWSADAGLNLLMSTITGSAKPENIVTMYSIPHVDISHLPEQPFTIEPMGVTINGLKALGENQSMQGRLFNETPINIGTDVDELLKVDHSVQLVIPDAGIISIPDYMLKEGDLVLRQDVDIFSGTSNYMVTSGTKYFTQSVRGGSIASIPIISDPMATYLSQNQNALMTSLIGDVASVSAGVMMTAGTGGLGTLAGAGAVASGINGIVGKGASIMDMKGTGSNPPAFLGSALVSSFNQTFWVVVTKMPVDNKTLVNSNYGYPMNKLAPLVFPTSGYIKTQGCNVSSDGTVPRWALQEINTMFNNGVLVN